MNWFASAVLLSWIPLVLLLFSAMPPRRAVLCSFLIAWLLLPMAGLKIAEGVPLYDKMSATCTGVLLGTLLFDTQSLYRFRLRPIDLPMLIWCLCPIATSVSNGLGLYDGVSTAFRYFTVWGSPYLIGRIYFGDLESLKELALALVVGGLVYVPLCLFEIRMSPQLHSWVYGFHQHEFAETRRFGGFRPTVFMQHGLMVGMWMCMTTLVGVWLWYARTLPQRWRGWPTGWMMAALAATAVACKSSGALVMMGGGMAVLLASSAFRTKFLVWCLVAAAPLYMVVRAGRLWDGQQAVDMAAWIAGDERAQSLAFRVKNEDLLTAKALERPILGWGGWGRSRVLSEEGRNITVTDGFWVIALGTHGALGLVSWTAALLLPAILVFKAMPASRWRHLSVAPATGLAMVVVLYVADCVPNGMVNPLFTLAAGGLAGLAMSSFLRAVDGTRSPVSHAIAVS